MDVENQPFYDESDSDDEKKLKSTKKDVTLDPDLRLLLRESRPLLQSRNAAVNDLFFSI